jgi:type III pantothenate kinase
MNLVIDVGNTLLKLAVFDANELKYKKTCIKSDFLMILDEVSEGYTNISDCLISSVGNFTGHQLSKLEEKYQVQILTHETAIPFSNLYGTPNTLGVDRIAVVSAAAMQFPHNNVLVIDAGSCITYDFLNSNKEYLGGAISPGVAMRYKALNKLTANLPLLEPMLAKKLIGDSTKASMHSGVINGILYEIDGFVSDYENIYNDLTVILTGGDAHFLRDSLKSDIFANSNFLLEGLNYILEHNKH